MDKTSSPQLPVHSLLLSKAINRFRFELKDDDESISNVESVEELLSQAQALEPPVSRNSKFATLLSRLEPILSHINDFAAIVAFCSGADAKATGLVWGSLRVILTLASPTGDTLDDVLNMLAELSLSLPRFRSYEENLPMDKALECALLDAYTEMTCFCARTIYFFRSNPHRQLVRFGWPKFNDDLEQTIKRLKRLSRIVDSEAEAVRLRTDTERNTELLAAMDLLKHRNIEEASLPCYYLPFGSDEQLYSREEILQTVNEALNPREGDSRRRLFALYGMGGVGKTKIALRYANSARPRFDAIFWVSADNPTKLTQSFLGIAQLLGLSPVEDSAQDAVPAVSKVKTWLAEARYRWLLVFDNADDSEILVNAWPGGAAGSVLLTSRDFTAGFGTSALGYHVEPFSDEAGVSALLSLVGRDRPSLQDRNSAMKIVHELGGLPLAINQICGFIVQQKLALEDVLPIYQRNSAKIDARKLIRGDYEHTLSTVWELSLSRLSGPSCTLQKLLAFFDPDQIHESILREGGEMIPQGDFEFLHGEMDFLDAKEALLKAALIDRSSEDATLKVHRLVQAAVIRRMSSEEREVYFDRAIELLRYGFPNTWNTVTSHQFTAWAKCERCLPHVNFLIVQSNKYHLRASDPVVYAELIHRCCWYLYERELYMQAQNFIKIGLSALPEKDTLMFASAIMLHGLIELDMNNIQTALESFLMTLSIRQNVMNCDDAFIASSFNSISLAYTELGNLEKAVEMGQNAIDIRLRTGSDRIGNSYSNMASTLLRMGKPDEAEEMLKRCPSLKNFTDETFLNSGNPRFSGDMVLLSRIRQKQSRLDEALRLSSKALAFRQNLLGNRLKTCDSLYQVAALLQLRGDLNSAIHLLEESVLIAESLVEGQGYLARTKFKLAQIYAELGNVECHQACLTAAAAIRGKILGNKPAIDASEEDYDKLVLWMLW